MSEPAVPKDDFPPRRDGSGRVARHVRRPKQRRTLEESLDEMRESFDAFARLYDERFSNVEMEVATIGALVERGLGLSDEDEKTPRVLTDTLWCCAKCQARLGIHDTSTDKMRIRHRGQVTYITPGVGGKIEQLCWGCGHLNVLEDTRPLPEK